MASRILGMGDVLTIIEQAEDAFDKAEAEKLEKKLLKNKELDLNDYLAQLKQIKKMGSFSGLLKMLPGFGKYANQVDDNELLRIESMIYSMTEEERRNPRVLNASRRIRIANGSGTSVQEINKFIKAFESTRDIMKKMKSGKMDPRMKNLMKRMNLQDMDLQNIDDSELQDLEKKLGKK
jgi:signal recognition particle subunit SRP54